MRLLNRRRSRRAGIAVGGGDWHHRAGFLFYTGVGEHGMVRPVRMMVVAFSSDPHKTSISIPSLDTFSPWISRPRPISYREKLNLKSYVQDSIDSAVLTCDSFLPTNKYVLWRRADITGQI
jgi:hypothetical protein